MENENKLVIGESYIIEDKSVLGSSITKIKIIDITKITVLTRNLDHNGPTHYDFRMRIADFHKKYKILEELSITKDKQNDKK